MYSLKGKKLRLYRGCRTVFYIKNKRYLTISGDGKTIYTGTSHGGVYRLTLQNYAPKIFSSSPVSDKAISIVQGDSLLFEVGTYDINADTLSYSWTLDNILIDSCINFSYLLLTTDLQIGYHSLKVEVADADTSVFVTWDIIIDMSATMNNKSKSNLPRAFSLMQNHPNPFNNETVIKYEIPMYAKITIDIYSLHGRKIKSLVDQYQDIGYHEIFWNTQHDLGHEVDSGIYIYRFEAVSNDHVFMKMGKMILIR